MRKDLVLTKSGGGQSVKFRLRKYGLCESEWQNC